MCEQGNRESQGERRTLVWFSLLSDFTRRLDGSLASKVPQIVVRHDLPADELVLKVRTGGVVMVWVTHCVGGGIRDHTYWMTPAACGAFVPFRIVHARTSSGPHVK